MVSGEFIRDITYSFLNYIELTARTGAHPLVFCVGGYMTDQMELFAIEYVRLGCKNATQAAKIAGYSEKTAYSQASDLLKRPEVRAKVEELKSQISQEVRDKMAVEVSSAIDALVDILHSPETKDSDKIKCATEILDRAGFITENKVSVDTNMVYEIVIDDEEDPL